jgi:hypothetical protein
MRKIIIFMFDEVLKKVITYIKIGLEIRFFGKSKKYSSKEEYKMEYIECKKLTNEVEEVVSRCNTFRLFVKLIKNFVRDPSK